MSRLVAILALLALTLPALAHDSTGFWAREHAAGRAPSAEWWDALGNQTGGLCCSFAEGQRVEDVDWDTKCQLSICAKFHYRVRLDGQWVNVPDAAVVTTPNEYGAAVVWPFYATDASGAKVLPANVRCFMPGAGA